MANSTSYQPPYAITSAILNLVAEISETIGRYTVLAEPNQSPHHSSLAGNRE
jgi:hypothetical protein